MGMDPLTIGLIGGGILGLGSSYMQSEAISDGNEVSREMNEKSLALQQSMFDFNKDRYESIMEDYHRLQGIYGGLQEDIVTYYRNLTGDKLSNERIGHIQKAHQRVQERIKRAVAQRYMGNSGLEAELLKDDEFKMAEEKSAARIKSDMDAIMLKDNFLRYEQGLANQKLGIANGISTSMASSANNMSNILSGMGAQSMASANAQANIYGSTADTLSGLLGLYSVYGR